MGVTRYYELHCDECDNSPDVMEPYLSDLRSHARKLGWKSRSEGHMQSRDLCPECVAADKAGAAE